MIWSISFFDLNLKSFLEAINIVFIGSSFHRSKHVEEVKKIFLLNQEVFSFDKGLNL